ncbi:MAG: Tn7 transposase TnsA N-terminal domain-containing protein [Clostridium sp.]|nr:Tn7 transposase TnsA N-terminal domain-containing protein [Clostridium sp.]
MGKRRPAWDYQHYLRYLKEGRGQGTGCDYKPWIYIHDFPSRGVSARIPGRTTGRIHHLLSRHEEYYFYILDADPDVLDIREQFPLRLTETLEIARALNIKHPWKSDFPFVMTTDFLVTREDGLHARAVKCSGELDNPRIIEKFSIEQAYWAARSVDWKIVTEKQICRDRALNCQWLYSGETPESLIPDPGIRREAQAALLSLVDEENLLPTGYIEPFENTFRLPAGSAIALYKSLIITGAISPDMSSKLFS